MQGLETQLCSRAPLLAPRQPRPIGPSAALWPQHHPQAPRSEAVLPVGHPGVMQWLRASGFLISWFSQNIAVAPLCSVLAKKAEFGQQRPLQDRGGWGSGSRMTAALHCTALHCTAQHCLPSAPHRPTHCTALLLALPNLPRCTADCSTACIAHCVAHCTARCTTQPGQNQAGPWGGHVPHIPPRPTHNLSSPQPYSSTGGTAVSQQGQPQHCSSHS